MTVNAQAGGQDGALSLASIFGDHAVLQRDQPIAVWGTGAPGSRVDIRFAGHAAVARTDAAGKWSAQLPSVAAGGPYVLTASSGSQSAVIEDVLVGDVILCGGQSNMALQMTNASNALADVPNSSNPALRFANIARDRRRSPLGDLSTPVQWQLASPQTTGTASAVCYHMAKSLQARYQVPVGFVNASLGGTAIQSWIGAAALGSIPKYRTGLDNTDADAPGLLARGVSHLASQTATILRHVPSEPRADGYARYMAVLFALGCLYLLRRPLRAGAVAAWAEITSGPMYRRLAAHLDGRGARGTALGIVIVSIVGVSIATVGTTVHGSTAPGAQLADGATHQAPIGHATLYNGMIAPLAGYRFRFAAGYQGESNAADSSEYRVLLPLLISNWRDKLGQADLPFLIVQLPSYGKVATEAGGHSAWATLRDAQLQTVQNDPRTALVTTLDFGDRTEIHPAQKSVVGARLARAARSLVYGEDVSPGGPEAVAAERVGRDIVVRFKHTGAGLRTYSSNVAIAFEACTQAGCDYVPGRVDHDSVVLHGANAPETLSIRYAWADAPFINLYSADDLPAGPFHLDIQ